MNEPIVRLTRPSDVNALSTLDLKTYHYPLELKKWKELAGQSGKPTEPKVVVVEIVRKPVGFALWQELDENVSRIIRLGVLHKCRFHGLGRLLIEKVVLHSQTAKKDRLRVVLPDIHCLPGDPDDVSGFLSKVGFHTTGEVVTDHCRMYGEWREGYVFERNIVHDSVRV